MKYIILPLIFIALTACGGGSSDSTIDTPPPPGVEAPPGVEGAMLVCEAPSRPPLESGFLVENPFPGLSKLRLPTMITQHPAHPGRWYVVEQQGKIVYFDESDTATVSTLLDFHAQVRDPAAEGSGRNLGLAFHPNYPTTAEIFVYYTGIENGVFASIVKRIILDDLNQPLAPQIETVFMFPILTRYHQGGDIHFGPDGYLYLGLGDGGGGTERAQDNTNLFGTMLRLDINGTGSGYSIPSDNPFVGNTACTNGLLTGEPCPEIFAWGLRNPYRWSFDSNGQLWVGDVGTNRQEEIDLIESGNNYGWGCYEGSLEFKPELCSVDDDLTFPVFEYNHSNGDGAIVGGYFYNGSINKIQGRYIFADVVSGRIWGLSEDGNGNRSSELLADTSLQITDLAVGLDGEIYLSARLKGQIHKLVSADTGGKNTIPTYLADTHCMSPDNPTEVAAELVPYEINSPFWSDGAIKMRYFSIPEGTRIEIDESGDWQYPIGSVLLKNFELNGQLIETRLFMRHLDGQWAGYTWEWNAQQTRATRVIGGKTADIQGQEWIYPSEAQCMVCHNSTAGFTLGLETAQLNRDVSIMTDNGLMRVNQLEMMDEATLFMMPLPDVSVLPMLADYLDANLPIEDRARAWLHTNCAQCHRENGFTPSSIDLRYTVPLQQTNMCDIEPSLDDLGLINVRLIAPGHPGRSILLFRLSSRDQFGMPPLATKFADPVGVQLIVNWIFGLNNCK